MCRCIYHPSLSLPSSSFLSCREEEESSGEEASSEEEQEAAAMDQGNGPAVTTSILTATPTTSTASSVSDRDIGKGRRQNAAETRCGENHLDTGDGGGTLEFLVTCLTVFSPFSILPPFLPLHPSLHLLISSLEPQRPQYATHEEAKQAFRDLLKEKVLPFPLGRFLQFVPINI